ncbi:MAG: hypothetical protein QGF90_14225 [Gammaproteobacteria bacterium]|jgi:hypothetical protein|nr:hypothetical protein [Gammaproteobacteria bacterium]
MSVSLNLYYRAVLLRFSATIVCWRQPLASLILASLCINATATTVLEMDIDDIARDAELVFEGTVLVSEARKDTNSGIISTYITFQIIDIIKGSYDANDLELKFMGGGVNGEVVQVSGLTIPEVGERGIYFVESLSRDLINPLLGWSQGHFIVLEDDGEPRISTTERQPVSKIESVADIPPVIRKPQAVLEGNNSAAAGVITEPNAAMINRALSVDEFKTSIIELLED